MSENGTQWNSNFSFLMAMIGSAVGLGNIWRYPYVLYSHGGGSFMIPYIVAIVLLGFSGVLLEYAVGYKFKTSLLEIYGKIKTKFRVIAWFTLLIVFLILSYYVCIVGWDLIYLVLSFFKGWGADPNNYFVTSVLHDNPTFGGMLEIVPIVFISCLIVWFVIWLISHRNINDGVSKFSNVAVPLLFVLIVIIVGFSLTLPGASIGYTAMFTPDWNALLDANIWLAAFGQVIFSLSIGMAIAITYSSYLGKKTNLTKNAGIVVASNSGFEVFNAIGVFSILGFMALSTGVGFDGLVTEGTGLAFVAFPEVFNVMGGAAYIIGPLFFFCILIAGITSAIALAESVTSSLITEFDLTRKKAVTILCIIGFCVTAIFTTGAGSTVLGIFDRILNNFALILAIVFECIIFAWFYKIDDLIEVLNRNTSIKIGSLWKYLIKFILPIVLLVLWVTGLVSTLSFSNNMSLFVELILFAVLFVVPFILNHFAKSRKVNEA
ncbi:sodium-dependent transporter [uncultured Methanobrevibacter sp.]|uniref:sodium-dependent transporter n=1 Tax=uncultured Methanobrevibacter sp. TaxID=253161 RepID=UPI0026E07AF5|nr:sodium-dependent transporter [uncultured Methanobrevibacter sp.]